MAKTRRLSRRMNVLLWLVVIVGLIGTLIYLEQISLLYVITTLALCGLLLIVGFSNLEGVARGDDTAGERS